MAVAVLDSEPLWRLVRARSGTARAEAVRAFLRSAQRRGYDIVVPSAVLAEVFRGGSDDANVNRIIDGSTGIRVTTSGRAIARWAGTLLARDHLDSCHVVDALVVGTAIRLGGGVVQTGDGGDLRSLARDHRNVRIAEL